MRPPWMYSLPETTLNNNIYSQKMTLYHFKVAHLGKTQRTGWISARCGDNLETPVDPFRGPKQAPGIHLKLTRPGSTRRVHGEYAESPRYSLESERKGGWQAQGGATRPGPWTSPIVPWCQSNACKTQYKDWVETNPSASFMIPKCRSNACRTQYTH